MGKRTLPTRGTTASSVNQPSPSCVSKRGKSGKGRGGVSSTGTTTGADASNSRSSSSINRGYDDDDDRIVASFKIPISVNLEEEEEEECMHDVMSSGAGLNDTDQREIAVKNMKGRKYRYKELVACIDGNESMVKLLINNSDTVSISSSVEEEDCIDVEEEHGECVLDSTPVSNAEFSQLRDSESVNNDGMDVIGSNAKSSDASNNSTPRRGTRVLPLRGSRMQSSASLIQNVNSKQVRQSAAPPQSPPSTSKAKGKANYTSTATVSGAVSGGGSGALPTRGVRGKGRGGGKGRLKSSEAAASTAKAAPLLVTKVGDDGNLYYCAICGEFGDVVCCDGCPKVFHPCCIPVGKSRTSLDNDDDPWYCPDCGAKVEFLEVGKEAEASLPEDVPSSSSVNRATTTTRRSRAKRRKCADCQKPAGTMLPCSQCHTFLHFPNCAEQIDEDEDLLDSATLNDEEDHRFENVTHLCTSCRAELVVNMDEELHHFEKGFSAAATTKKRRGSGVKIEEEDEDMAISSLLVKRSMPKEQDHEYQLPDSQNETLNTEQEQNNPPHEHLEEEEQIHEEEEEEDEYSEKKQQPIKSKRKTKHKPKHSLLCNENIKTAAKKHKSKKEKKKRKRRKRSDSLATFNSNNGTPSTSSKHKKRKVELEPTHDPYSSNVSEEDEEQQSEQQKTAQLPKQPTSPEPKKQQSPSKRPVKSTPPFFFFLSDSKLKIEKVLMKKVSVFKSYPKGSMQRNALIAKEGALWWSKLSLEEKLKWQEVSMKDFGDRVIAWKEEMVIGTMKMDLVDMEEAKEDEEEENIVEEVVLEDKEIICSIHAIQDGTITSALANAEECYLPLHPSAFLNNKATTIISRKKEEIFSSDHDTSPKIEGCNPTLLELLQDLRFHPISMIHPHRKNKDFDFPDFSKMSVPYFDVQGPVSTSIGDECLGCTRGWCHFCPVLKRQFPAVEHRAKLQPPLSSLMATRVGLGLKWKEYYRNNNHPHSMLQDYSMMQLQQQQSLSLDQPCSRTDDIVQFLEEAMAMKIPHVVLSTSASRREAEITSTTTKVGSKKKNQNNIHAQTVTTTAIGDNHMEMIIGGDDGTGIVDADGIVSVYKCGRCGTTTHTKLGCIKCRRSLLVSDVSKRQAVLASTVPSSHSRENNTPTPPPPSNNSNSNNNNNTNNNIVDNGGTNPPGFLKVQTSMLGRAPFIKNVNAFEKQRMGDVAVASAMSCDQWKPNVILPDKATLKKNIAAAAAMKYSRSTTPANNTSTGFYSSGTTTLMEENLFSYSKQENASSPQQQQRRQQPKRNTTQSSDSQNHDKHHHISPEGRQQMAEIRQEEANELQKKCLSISICGIMYGLMRRDPLRLFAEPVPLTVDGYHSVVVKPMDFRKMKEKVLDEQYTSLGAFVSDAKVLCANAMAYNPPGSIYWNTAKDILTAVEIMQKRASDWMTAVKNCHNASFTRNQIMLQEQAGLMGKHDPSFLFSNDDKNTPTTTPRASQKSSSSLNHTKQHKITVSDPWSALRKSWPGAAEILEDGQWLRSQIQSGFTRTKENEGAYYGYLAVRRAAAAAAASLAYPGCNDEVYNICVSRTSEQDEELRNAINNQVSRLNDPIRLLDEPGWRETLILHILRQVQNRRVEGRVATESGCARCDGVAIIEEASKLVMSADEAVDRQQRRKKHDTIGTVPRIASSRLHLTAGFGTNASSSAPNDINLSTPIPNEYSLPQQTPQITPMNGTSVHGSSIHGWGFFADYPFSKGQIVAEYIGEYVSNPVADAREKMYQQRRIQDYQFRVDHNLIIDATLKGNSSRYINHSCSPNCVAKIVPGEPPHEHLKRVCIVSRKDIAAMEEITYDYQFPLELNLQERIPCHCGSDMCRGFMNWDLPEKESSQKNRCLRSLVIHGQNEEDFVGRLRHHKK